MSLSQKFIVLPFKRLRKGQIVVGEMRQASSATSAERMAESMSNRFVGVAAYAVMIDDESGDMTEPKLLRSHGETLDISAEG